MSKNLIHQKRGAARPRLISPSHRHLDDVRHPRFQGSALILDVMHAPGRTSPLAKVRLSDGREVFVLPHEGARVGTTVRYLSESTIDAGNTTAISMATRPTDSDTRPP